MAPEVLESNTQGPPSTVLFLRTSGYPFGLSNKDLLGFFFKSFSGGSGCGKSVKQADPPA